MVSINNGEFWIDGYLEKNLKNIEEKAIPNNWDNVGIIFSREGSGKSTLATQICKRLYPNFSNANIVFSPDEFSNAIDNAAPGTAILWDEAITGANINDHAKSLNQKIISKLTMVRKKQLHIILCFPYLYMMNKYFVSRCLWSIYAFAKDFDDRGHARFYNSLATEKLYNLMKTKYKYDYMGALREMKGNFYFKFSKKFCVDIKEYENKKDEASRLADKNSKSQKRKTDIQIITRINDLEQIPIERLCKYFGTSSSSYYREKQIADLPLLY